MDRREKELGGKSIGYVTGPPIVMRRRVTVRSGETVDVDFDVSPGGT